MTAAGEVLEAIDAALYADVFGCAVTEHDLWRYSRRAISREQMRELLADPEMLRGTLRERGGLYCLAGHEEVLDRHRGQRRHGTRLRRRARAVARVVQHLPFVRGLLLTGSVAADNAGPGADIDLLVIVAPGRIATVFALLGTAARLTSRRLLCPNHYAAEDSLEVSRDRTHYIAREVAQACALTETSRAFGHANRWVRRELPNAEPSADCVDRVPGGILLQRAAEWPLRGRLGHALERRLRRLASARLRAHYSQYSMDVPAQVAEGLEAGRELRFHGVNSDRKLLASYERRRSAALEALSS